MEAEGRGLRTRIRGVGLNFGASLESLIARPAWAEEFSHDDFGALASFEIKETVMGHAVGSKVVRAYDRTDYLERRIPLLERWADHCTGNSEIEKTVISF